MKEKFGQLKKKLQSILAKKMVGDRSRDVTKHWQVSLILSGCIAIILCVVGGYAWYTVDRGAGSDANVVPVRTVTFEKSRLDRVAAQSNAVRDTYIRLQSARPDAPKTGLPEVPITESVTTEDDEGDTDEIPVLQ